MGEEHEIFIQSAASIGAGILLIIAVFQILLLFGAPWGEYSWGGKFTGVLPQAYRWASLPAAILLFLMALELLVYSGLLSIDFYASGRLVGVMAIFLGMNTLGNAASKSRKERLAMTPLSGLSCLCCLIVAILGT